MTIWVEFLWYEFYAYFYLLRYSYLVEVSKIGEISHKIVWGIKSSFLLAFTNGSRCLRTLLAAATAAKSLQSCPTLCDPIDCKPTRLPRPWDSPGKNTGVGCHFLLQCMKVKSESEVAQSCPTLSSSMDCSLPGSSAHGIFQARVLEWGATAFSREHSLEVKFMISVYPISREIRNWKVSTPKSFL